MSANNFSDDGVVTDINVTPLVDVMLVLLIIFMVTTHIVTMAELKVNLPKTAAAEAASTTTLTVSLNQQGEIHLMDLPIDLNGLKSSLAREAGLNPNLRVTLAADGRIPYEQVIGVLDAVKQAGVVRVALASQQMAGP